jgi:DNA polymerase-3 subunit alpha
VADTNRMRMDGEWHLKSTEEMTAAFGDHPEALLNSTKIAERCNIELPFDRIDMPKPELPDKMTEIQFLTQQATEGLKRRLGDPPPAYQDRLAYELDIIKQTDFGPYLLLVGEIMAFAREQGMLTAPRGSVNGSLVAYATGMSEIDPIKHDIIFERFLTLGRKGSMPDVDMDFPSDRRDEVINYISNRYGADHVAQIVTFGTLAARAAVRDVGRVLGMEYGLVDRIAKLIPVNPITPFDINRSIETVSELKKLYQTDDSVRRLLDSAQRIEGVARHASTHAAGLVVSSDPLQEHVPLTRSGDEGHPVAQFTFQTIEKIGLLKLDVLGLSNFRTIQHALRLIQTSTGNDLKPEEIPLEDTSAFDLLRKGRTDGIFQLESAGMTRTLRDLAPSNIGELAAIIALYRPGPMANIDTYIERKHGRSPPEFLHEKLEPILRDTFGVLVYADQVLMIARQFAGYSWDEADSFRKAVGKKIREALVSEREKFVSRSSESGIPQEIAEEVFKLIEPFAGYGFNKAHAVSYAVIAYWTAWLKAHYPVEFLSALLATEAGDVAKIARIKAEAELLGVDVLPPHINQSGITFQPRNQAIVFGLAAVKNVGEAAVEAIVEARENTGAFTSLMNACERVDLQKAPRRAWESLIKVGALDELGERQALLHALEPAIKRGQKLQADRASGQATMFASTVFESSQEPAFEMPVVAAASEPERRRWEKDLLGLYVTQSPLSDPMIGEQLAANVDVRIIELEEVHTGQTLTIGGIVANVRSFMTRKGHAMGAVTLEDPPESIEVICFPRIWERIAPDLEADRVVIASGRIEGDNNSPRMLADNIYALSTVTDTENDGEEQHGSASLQTTNDAGVEDDSEPSQMSETVRPILGPDATIRSTAASTESSESPPDALPAQQAPAPPSSGEDGNITKNFGPTNQPTDTGLSDSSADPDTATHSESTSNEPPRTDHPRLILRLRRTPDPAFDIDLLKRLDAAAKQEPGETDLELDVVKTDGSVARLRWPDRVNAGDRLRTALAREFGDDAVTVA